jgi:hypothetical protein
VAELAVDSGIVWTFREVVVAWAEVISVRTFAGAVDGLSAYGSGIGRLAFGIVFFSDGVFLYVEERGVAGYQADSVCR